MGHVLQAGAGQITARQAAVNGGIPMDVPATTVNKVCLSGMDAIYQADRRIRPVRPTSWSPAAWSR
jgi:acetyl-CoA C-acetyltransferase